MDSERSLSNFQVLSRLGEGAFGQVFKVKRKSDNQTYALKKIKTTAMKEKDRVNALNEIRILASVVGENIIGFKDSFYDDNSSDLCIVLEFAGQGDITRKIKEHSKQKKFIEEAEIWKAMVHIAKGIRVLHNNNILHRDLKSANIFITQDGVYKLGDLNISKVLTKGLARTQTGTPYYCSPEVWKDTPYGPKSDMWSFGCVLYEMAAQKPPFTASDVQGLYRKIMTGVFSRIPNIYSNQLSDMINSLLNLNPNLRPSTEDILSSPIVQKHYQGDHLSEIAKSVLLETIQFNHQGWKQINSNLPKSQYYIEKEEGKMNEQNQQQCKQGTTEMKRSQLRVPQQIKIRPTSSTKSDKKCINVKIVEREIENKSALQSSEMEREPSVQNKRQLVLSACGKGIGKTMAETPEKPKINRRVLLPPLDSAKGKKQRRGSESYEPALFLPPKPSPVRRDTSKDGKQQNPRRSSNEKSGYHINVLGSAKKL